jgi:hypothetical protein
VAGKTRIYYDKNGSFEIAPNDPFLDIHQQGMSAAADYDNDGDLDILDLGEISYVHEQISLFKNYQFTENTKPTVPSNLHVEYLNNETILRWDRAQDNTTPIQGLTYNVYLTLNSENVISSAALNSGKRIVVGIGNAQYNNFMKIKNLKIGNYKWSVQSIDNCYEGSDFAPEASFQFSGTGITNIDKSKTPSCTIYPNPFTNTINILGLEADKAQCSITVSDLLGRTLLHINEISSLYQIDLSTLSAGIYVMTIIQEKTIWVKKIEKK